jgi:hypothetical protein
MRGRPLVLVVVSSFGTATLATGLANATLPRLLEDAGREDRSYSPRPDGLQGDFSETLASLQHSLAPLPCVRKQEGSASRRYEAIGGGARTW